MGEAADRTRLARALKALAHPSRLAALKALADEPLCVQDLQAVMGSELSTVSRHLKLLADAGLIESQRQGQRIVYRLKVPCIGGFLDCIGAVLAGKPHKALIANLAKELGIMNVERAVRGLGGLFVLLSLGLAQWHSRYWLFFTAFVGLNLLQSALTDWCPAMTILRRLGLKDASAGSCCCPSTGSGPRPREESRGGHPDEQTPTGKA